MMRRIMPHWSAALVMQWTHVSAPSVIWSVRACWRAGAACVVLTSPPNQSDDAAVLEQMQNLAVQLNKVRALNERPVEFSVLLDRFPGVLLDYLERLASIRSLPEHERVVDFVQTLFSVRARAAALLVAGETAFGALADVWEHAVQHCFGGASYQSGARWTLTTRACCRRCASVDGGCCRCRQQRRRRAA